MRKNSTLRETCQQYLARRLSEGWREVCRFGNTVFISPPDGSFIRPVNLLNDTETLRPNAAGDETNIPVQFPDSGEHWDKVDDVTPDDLSTYVLDNTSGARDLYNLPAPSGVGTINSIQIYFRVWTSSGFTAYATPSLKSNSTVTDGTEITLSGGWENHSEQWSTNPADSESWEWDDISTLQIGIVLRRGNGNAACTQLYVEIDYTPPEYYSSGYIGDVIDCSTLAKTYNRLEWSETTPEGTSIEIKIRSSPDQVEWTDWEVIYASPCESFATQVQRYLEWRATLSTTDTTQTPTLSDITFEYTKRSS